MRKPRRTTKPNVAPLFWSPSRQADIIPAPFLSERGHPMFVARDAGGALTMLLEIEQARGASWWTEGGGERVMSAEACEDLKAMFGDDRPISPVPQTAYECDGRHYLTQEGIEEATGPLWPRGVHLAPWCTTDLEGRVFVVIDAQHRLVAHTEARHGEDEGNVKQLLAMALEIADPQPAVS